MKVLTMLALILYNHIALAISPDSEMNDELMAIYDVPMSPKDSSELLGKSTLLSYL